GRPPQRGVTSGTDEVLEAPCVHCVGWRGEPVAGCPGLDRGGTQHLAQPEHVVLEGLGRRAGWVVTPERGEEAVGAADLAGAEDQSREQCALTSATRSDGRTEERRG